MSGGARGREQVAMPPSATGDALSPAPPDGQATSAMEPRVHPAPLTLNA